MSGHDPIFRPGNNQINGGYDTYTDGSGSQAGGESPPPNTETTPTEDYTPESTAPLTGCSPNPTTSGALTGTVQRFDELPTTPAANAVYKVQGSAETGMISSYVRWNGSVWEEAVKPGLKNSLDPETMPWALVRLADGTFEFAPFCWRPRRVGDEVSNPAPAFVNRSIRDVFFYQNRLGFLADESVIFSVAGDYGDFWRRTVLDYLDADTLSVSATTTDVALLDHAVPFNDGIMLFSAQRQFALANGEAGTSATSLEMNPVTSYSMAPGVRPVPLGDQVMFASDQGSYTSVQEYTRLDGRDATDAAEITAHVPGLLPVGVSRLVPAQDINALFALTRNSTTPEKIYAYQFYWDGDHKIISAWRSWAFANGQVISGTFIAGKLHLVIRRQNEAFLETIDLREEAVSDNQDHMIYLDRQVTLTGTYDAGTDLTTFTFPYSPYPTRLRLVRTKLHADPESLIPGAKVTVAGTTVTVQGDESANPVTAGEAFQTSMVFSRQYPLDFQGRPLTSGRLQLRSMRITYADTPFFAAIVQPYGPDANIDAASLQKITQITAQKIGNAGHLVGTLPYGNGSTAFSVRADANQAIIALVNDTPFSSNWVSAEWEGLYYSRAR